MRHAVDRYLVFLHHFQQRRLRFRRSAVDFVGQNDLAHHRAGLEFQLVGFEVDDGKTGHVGGRNVGRELNALERAIERFGQRAGQRGFAHARHILDEHVTLAQKRDERQFDHFVLSNDDLSDILL